MQLSALFMLFLRERRVWDPAVRTSFLRMCSLS